MFIQTFLSLAQQGLNGKPVHLQSVHTLDWSDAPRGALVSDGQLTRVQPFILSFADYRFPPNPHTPIRIDFLTPTCLRHDDQDQRIPTFHALICRLRDRLSSLSKLYESQPWQADFGAIDKLAAEAEILFCHGGWQHGSRRSSKTGQTMPLAGFLGTVVYEKVHPALWRLLNFGQEVHVGSQTVWGSGAYRVVLDE